MVTRSMAGLPTDRWEPPRCPIAAPTATTTSSTLRCGSSIYYSQMVRDVLPELGIEWIAIRSAKRLDSGEMNRVIAFGKRSKHEKDSIRHRLASGTLGGVYIEELKDVVVRQRPEREQWGCHAVAVQMLDRHSIDSGSHVMHVVLKERGTRLQLRIRRPITLDRRALGIGDREKKRRANRNAAMAIGDTHDLTTWLNGGGNGSAEEPNRTGLPRAAVGRVKERMMVHG